MSASQARDALSTNPKVACLKNHPPSPCPELRIQPHTIGVMLFAGLLTGCTSVPMNYAQWKKEQEDRRKFEQAGLPYKSPAQLRAEAAEMRRIAEKTTFSPATK